MSIYTMTMITTTTTMTRISSARCFGERNPAAKSLSALRARSASLFRGEWRVVFGDVELPPLTVFDAFADLRGGFVFLRLLVGIDAFADAHLAFRGMLSREAIQQTAMALAPITMAVTRLLIQKF